MTVGATPYNFCFYDANGNAFEDLKSTGFVTTHFGKGRIHLYCVNAEEEESADALTSYFKSFGTESFLVHYQIIVITHTDKADKENATKRIRSFAEKAPIWEANLMNPKDVENLKDKLADFLKRAKSEHPELFDGCEVKKGSKKKAAKGGDGSGKKKCVIC